MDHKERLRLQFPVLESERLRLRGLELKDSEILYACITHPQVQVYTAFKPHTLLFPDRLMRYLMDSYQHLRDVHFAVEWKETGDCIGLCSLQRWVPGSGSARLGYLLAPEWWNRGIATEAVQLISRFGFEQLELRQIEACCGEANLASRRVLEKCGYSEQGSVGAAFVTQLKYTCDRTLTVRG